MSVNKVHCNKMLISNKMFVLNKIFVFNKFSVSSVKYLTVGSDVGESNEIPEPHRKTI